MPTILWDRLTNPILSLDDWSLKDACCIEHAGGFELFTSAFDEQHSTILQMHSPDLLDWSGPIHHWTGDELNAVGVCSPSIVRDEDGRYVLHYNTWGEQRPRFEQLYARVSDDLESWSDPIPMAGELTAAKRCIDAALARHGRRWFLAYKEHGTARIATAETLDGPWRFVTDDGKMILLRPDGTDVADDGMTHENAQFLDIDGTWHVLMTDYRPHEPWLYRLEGDPDAPASWARWVDGRRIEPPAQKFNSMPAEMPCVQEEDFVRPLFGCNGQPGRVRIEDGQANAAFCLDRRGDDGWFYLIYGGKNQTRRNDFNGRASGHPWPRGWNRLGIARSRDLVDWQIPPDEA